MVMKLVESANFNIVGTYVMTDNSWQPSASLEVIKKRASLLQTDPSFHGVT